MVVGSETFQHVFLIGIGGVGMSAIAHVLLERGYQVSGSDISESDNVIRLREQGAKIYIGQDAENIDESVNVVVRSTAIRENNVEYLRAKELNIPIWHRSQMLNALMKDRKGVCIAGSHGKTTTSSMVALCLKKCQISPTFVVGGVINELGTNAHSGQSDWFVIEADESDGSLINFHPWLAVITNIDEDHLDHYKDIEEIKDIFKQFMQQCEPSGRVIICADDFQALSLKDQAPAPVITYGESEGSDYHIRNQRQEGKLNKADIYFKEEYLGELVLQLPGKHSMLNATAALAVCREVDLDFQAVADVLYLFKGTKRRFQIAGVVNDVTVVDDYAHHPNEIKATLQGAKAYHKGRLIVLFQPHRYSRTQFLAKDFAEALNVADQVCLLDVYPAGEDPIPGVSSHLIIDNLKTELNAQVLAEEDVPETMKNIAEPGDMILVMGAGSIWLQAPKIVAALRG